MSPMPWFPLRRPIEAGRLHCAPHWMAIAAALAFGLGASLAGGLGRLSAPNPASRGWGAKFGAPVPWPHSSSPLPFRFGRRPFALAAASGAGGDSSASAPAPP